jgi:hypothetical protein
MLKNTIMLEFNSKKRCTWSDRTQNTKRVHVCEQYRADCKLQHLRRLYR